MRERVVSAGRPVLCDDDEPARREDLSTLRARLLGVIEARPAKLAEGLTGVGAATAPAIGDRSRTRIRLLSGAGLPVAALFGPGSRGCAGYCP